MIIEQREIEAIHDMASRLTRSGDYFTPQEVLSLTLEIYRLQKENYGLRKHVEELEGRSVKWITNQLK